MAMVGAQDRFTLTARYGVLIAFSAFCLFPFLWMLDTAFKPIDEVLSTTPSFLIRHPTLVNFATVLLHSPFLIYLRNSIIVSGFSTLVTMVSSTFCAYVLSRWPRQSPVRVVAGALLASQMIPGVLLLVPLYMTMRDLGLLSTYLSLIIVYCTFMVPLAVFMLRSFFDALPVELEEAAELDGCSRPAFLIRILLPLSVPGLLATGLFGFVTAWNEFMFGYVLINDDAHRTLTPGIMLFRGAHSTDWGSLMAASVLTILPVAVSFLYLQRFLSGGLSVGAVKG
ncbi:carbohydrate ABC transporter permease [Acidisoma cellulosilytica]|uniref:Carbohydrate ABC transporter permease n=1 Tax=Acidisoma cellulosilyticum TaxID=2802395 RepID=A0A964E4Z0_9PROT|nr:carbohydrate ABC transporter permease [Acidisoma cellulosilyticum]MCB8881448.1 carbohydrate ABC transporter permease [Acidisoma cellulosilyticum]